MTIKATMSVRSVEHTQSAIIVKLGGSGGVGTASLVVTNPAEAEWFKPGREFDVCITPKAEAKAKKGG